jgi:hypothetical protein
MGQMYRQALHIHPGLTQVFWLISDPQTPEGFILTIQNMVKCQQPLFWLTANG